MDEARAVADSMLRRDGRHSLTDTRWEDAVMEAALALCEGSDPREAVHRHLAREARWRRTHLSMLMQLGA